MTDSKMPHRGSSASGDAPVVERMAFPQAPEDFEADARVSYSKLDNKWILEDDDGSEWEFDDSKGKWIPSVWMTCTRLRDWHRAVCTCFFRQR